MTLIFKLIRQKKILLIQKTSNNYITLADDIVQLPDLINTQIKKQVSVNKKMLESYPLNILFEDNDILVIDKPSGLAVQPGTNTKLALSEILQTRYDETIFPVHRLDKGTSGCIVFAKNIQTSKYLAEQFKNRTIEKKYVCAVHGIWNKTIKNINNDQELIKSHRLYQMFEEKSAMTFISDITHFKYLSMLTVTPKTGRKHQIRIHLAMYNHPIIGDDKYGLFKKDRKANLKRLMLHAHSLKFIHPKTDLNIIIQSNMTSSFQDAIKRLDKTDFLQ